MKIEFLTEEDLYVLPLFEEFLRNYAADFEIVRISCCRILGNRPRMQLARELMWLYGVAGFSRLLARHGAAALLSRFRREKNASRYYSIGQLCDAYRIPYSRVGNPNETQFVNALAQRGTDLIVSVACPYILKPRLLQTPRSGCINLHNARLPRYKGMMPTFWQLYHGEPSIGLTIHTMTEKIDEGQALFQDSLEVQQGETLDQLIQRSKRRAAHCLAQVLGELRDGTAVPVPLGKENASYFTFPNRQQIQEFHRRGLRAI